MPITFSNAAALSGKIMSSTLNQLQPVTAANSAPKTTFKSNSSANQNTGYQMDNTQLNNAVSAYYSLPGKMLGAKLLGQAASGNKLAGAIGSYLGGGNSNSGLSFNISAT